MTDFGGGRVYIEAMADAGNFRSDLQAKIDAAVAGVKLTVPVEADPEHLRRSIETAVEEAGTGIDVQIPVHADSTGLREEVDAARREAEFGQEITIKVRTDRSGVPGVGGGGGGGGAEQGARSAAQDASSAWDAVGQHWASVGQSLLGNVWVLGALAGGLDALASAGGAAIGALAPLAGVVAALPGAVASGGATLGTLFLGLSGVTKAAGALEKQQTSSGISARQYADQQYAAAERVASARQALGNTEYDVGQQTVQAARSVQDAEYSLQIAYRSERDALQNLMDVRQAAARQLEDAANAATDARLSAEGAQLSLEQARQAYVNVATDPNATKLQREQAQLAVDEAEQRLKEAQLQQKRAGEDNAKTQKRGIDGNLQVKAATEQVADAYHGVDQAVLQLREAQRIQARDAVTGAQRIRDAQRSLNDALRAQREATQQVGSSATAANQALSELSPAGRNFAKLLQEIKEGPLRELRDAAQTALLPGLGSALKQLSYGLLPSFKSIVRDTGHALGDMAKSAAQLITSGPFTRDFTQLGKDNAQIIRDLTPGLRSVLNILRNLAMAAMPLLDDMARSLSNDAARLDDFIQKSRDSGKLDEFFRKVGHTVHQWGAIISNVAVGIFNVLKAAYGPGDELNNSLVNITKHFREWTGSTAGQDRMHKFFEQGAKLAQALGRALSAIVGALLNINNNGAITNILNALADAGPGIAALAGAFSSGFVSLFSTFAKILADIAQHGGPAGTALKVVFAAIGAIAAIAIINKALGISKLAEAIFKTAAAVKALQAAEAGGKLPALLGVLTGGKIGTVPKIAGKGAAAAEGAAVEGGAARAVGMGVAAERVGAEGAVAAEAAGVGLLGPIAIGVAAVAGATALVVNGIRKSREELKKFREEADTDIHHAATVPATYKGAFDELTASAHKYEAIMQSTNNPDEMAGAVTAFGRVITAQQHLVANTADVSKNLGVARDTALLLAHASGVDLTGGVGKATGAITNWYLKTITADPVARRYAGAALEIYAAARDANGSLETFLNTVTGLQQVEGNAVESQDQYRQQLNGLKDQLDHTSRSIRGNSEAAVNNRIALEQQIDAAVNAAKQASAQAYANSKATDKQGKLNDAAKAYTDVLGTNIDALKVHASHLGINSHDFDVLVGKMHAVPASTPANIKSNVSHVNAEMDELQRKLTVLAASASIYGPGSYFEQTGGKYLAPGVEAPKVGGHAAGGPVSPQDGPTWVGELGPELFFPDVSGTIVPHDLSVKMTQTLKKFTTALHDNLMGAVAWLAAHPQQVAQFTALHPDAAAAMNQALRQQIALHRGYDIGEGSGLAQVLQPGAIQVFNPRPEPAAQSVASRLRRLRVLSESPLPTTRTYTPTASAT